MLLPKFDFHEPTSTEEACQIMAELGRNVKPIAGGTDLIVNMKKGIISPKHLVSLSRIDNLKKLELSKDLLKIGACVTAAELAESQKINNTLGALSNGAFSLGSPLIRNLATVAGNLITARPAADLPPPLIAYGATVVLKNNNGERSIPLDDFFIGPGKTIMNSDEILTEILVEKPPDYSGAGYIKLGARKALAISLVNVAAFISLDGQNGSIQMARIVLGAVAPTPIRATSAERVLLGEKPGRDLFAKAGEASVQDSEPITDFRASAEYRRIMVSVLTKRALNLAYAKAKDSG
jgi:carbon-monoxide dehydrogenase medium subunit